MFRYDLAYRWIPCAEEYIGKAAFDALPLCQKSALVSYAFWAGCNALNALGATFKAHMIAGRWSSARQYVCCFRILDQFVFFILRFFVIYWLMIDI